MLLHEGDHALRKSRVVVVLSLFFVFAVIVIISTAYKD